MVGMRSDGDNACTLLVLSGTRALQESAAGSS
jgi:hypothetical protein